MRGKTLIWMPKDPVKDQGGKRSTWGVETAYRIMDQDIEATEGVDSVLDHTLAVCLASSILLSVSRYLGAVKAH